MLYKLAARDDGQPGDERVQYRIIRATAHSVCNVTDRQVEHEGRCDLRAVRNAGMCPVRGYDGCWHSPSPLYLADACTMPSPDYILCHRAITSGGAARRASHRSW